MEARDEGDVSHQGAAREGRTDGLEGLAGRARKRLEEKMVPNDASRERERESVGSSAPVNGRV